MRGRRRGRRRHVLAGGPGRARARDRVGRGRGGRARFRGHPRSTGHARRAAGGGGTDHGRPRRRPRGCGPPHRSTLRSALPPSRDHGADELYRARARRRRGGVGADAEPGDAQRVAAEITGLSSEKVRIHTTFSGGGFGRRLEPDFVSEAVRVSKAVGAPVKVIWTREDDMRNGFYRPTTYNRFAAGLDGSGRPVAWTHRIAGTPLRLKFGPLEKGLDDSLVDGAIDLPYAIPNVLVDQVVLELPAVPRGPWRSVGVSHNGFVTECFLDEVAAAAGRDPFELRRELLRDKARHRRTLELAADKAGWGTPLPAGRGRGIALAEWGPTVCAEVAEVSVDPSGTVRVHRVTCAVDCGPAVNLGQIEAQMQGGIVFGLTAALYGEITIERGRVVQGNFDTYRMVRMPEAPVVEVYVVPSTDAQGGTGEPGVPPIAPAVCNAIFALTGRRVRKLPIGKLT